MRAVTAVKDSVPLLNTEPVEQEKENGGIYQYAPSSTSLGSVSDIPEETGGTDRGTATGYPIPPPNPEI